MQRLFIAVLVSIAAGAIGRGVIIAFALDAKVARMIQSAVASPNVGAISWLLSGLIAMVFLTLWLALRVDERIHDYWSPSPKLGSLTFEEPFVSALNKSVATGRVDAELTAKIQNTNDQLIKAVGEIWGDANGKAVGPIPVTLLIAANKTVLLVVRIADLPLPPVKENQPAILGHFRYELAYAFAPSGSRSRKTMKRLSWQLAGPIPPGAPGDSKTYNMTVLFDAEAEE